MAVDKRPSEYGGVPGLIQPVPHVPSAEERRMLLTATNPADPLSGNEILDLVPPA